MNTFFALPKHDICIFGTRNDNGAELKLKPTNKQQNINSASREI